MGCAEGLRPSVGTPQADEGVPQIRGMVVEGLLIGHGSDPGFDL